ncbi:MAG: phasin family protein [Zoogloeaceae bacterium]|jgi:phasin family protein|nr:phasin family protein [Zoogloeaceae bacterium]
MSTPNFEQLVAAQKTNAELASTLLRATFNGIERLSALNLAASRDFLNATVANVQQVLAAKNPGDLAKLNVNLTQPGVEKWLDYSRNVYDLLTSVQKEVASTVQGQYTEFSRSATANLDRTKAAPGGDVFAAVVKSVLDASNRTFEQANAFAKQAASIAEANIQAATATAKAAASTKQPAAKK